MIERRFAILEKISPATFRVVKVLKATRPPLIEDKDKLVLPAPPQYTDEELPHMALVNQQWMYANVLSSFSTKGRGAVPVERDEVVWSGHVYNLGGYAKANRELIFRLVNSIKVKLHTHGDLLDAETNPDPIITQRLHFYRKVEVSDNAAFVRFFTPRIEETKRYRICYSMMETSSGIHPDYINRLNAYYDETWTPTHWNAEMLRKSGCKIPIHVMPLGIHQEIFYPQKNVPPFPKCELVSRLVSGRQMRPDGFVFFQVFQPTFRKGLNVLLPAFERAFHDDPDTCLVLGVTTYSNLVDWVKDEIKKYIRRSRVYILSRTLSERDLARIYNASDAFVSTSLGEGFNLPMVEAAACGKPVVAPLATSHLDLIDEECANVFHPEGMRTVEGAEMFCPWYDGMQFAYYGLKSREQLIEQLKEVRHRYPQALIRAERFRQKLLQKYTWDHATARVLARLRDLWGA